MPLPHPSVYGPPEYFDLPSEPETKSPVPEIETDFTVEEEILEDVYGPPEWFD